MKIVKLTKISGKPDSDLPIGYAVEGPLTSAPEVGSRVALDGYIRTSANESFLWFRTTEVQELSPSQEGLKIATKNSVWVLKELN